MDIYFSLLHIKFRKMFDNIRPEFEKSLSGIKLITLFTLVFILHNFTRFFSCLWRLRAATNAGVLNMQRLMSIPDSVAIQRFISMSMSDVTMELHNYMQVSRQNTRRILYSVPRITPKTGLEHQTLSSMHHLTTMVVA